MCRSLVFSMLIAFAFATSASGASGAGGAGTASGVGGAGDTGGTAAVSEAGSARQAGEAAAAAQAQTAPEDDPDLDVDPLQPDYTIITLPTTARVPRFKSAFRVTHRFRRPLGQGDIGSLFEDFFGLDSGAMIGLEYRFGIMRGAHVGIRRTSDRTIELFSEYNLLQERNGKPVGLSAIASIDGTNNFRDSYTPALGVAISRSLMQFGTVYAEPIWVNNSNPLPSELGDDNDAVLLGLGARLRVRPSVYLVGEIVPRVTGYDPGVSHATFGIEKLLGLHVFQLNFSNSFGTTMGQVARGAPNNDDWYMGFSISRKFF